VDDCTKTRRLIRRFTNVLYPQATLENVVCAASEAGPGPQDSDSRVGPPLCPRRHGSYPCGTSQRPLTPRWEYSWFMS